MAVCNKELLDSQLLIHPSVLISVLTNSPSLEGPSLNSSTKEHTVPLSGSGFIWGEDSNGNSLVVTSASWLSSVVKLEWDSSNNSPAVTWRYLGENDSPRIIVLMGRTCKEINHGDTVQVEAAVSRVCLMSDVIVTMREVLNSLSHWRAAIGEGVARGEEEGTLTQSLLLPLSCLVLLRLNTRVRVRPSCYFSLSAPPLTVGQSVVSVGTPYGAFCPEVFFNCVTTGTVCKTLGRGKAVLITDISHPCGSEGSLILKRAMNYPETTVVSEFLGVVIAGLSSAGGQASGLSLCCSAHSVWRALTGSGVKVTVPSLITHVAPGCGPRLVESVVLVLKDDQWGTGVLLTHDTVLTCSHVIGDGGGVSIVTRGCKQMKGTLLFSSTLPDFALLKLPTPVGHAPTLLSWFQDNCVHSLNNTSEVTEVSRDCNSPTQQRTSDTHSHPCCLLEGRDVFLIGFGCQDPYETSDHTPLITRGSVIKVVLGEDGEGVMLVTTAVCLPGMSGGVVVDVESGEPLGMAVSNSKDVESGTSYPRLNYCLPFSWLLPPLLHFLSTGDATCLRTLTSSGQAYSDIWRLKSQYPTKFLNSKL